MNSRVGWQRRATTKTLATSVDGRWLAFAQGPQLRLFDIAAQKEVATARLWSASVDVGFTTKRQPALLVVSRGDQSSAVTLFRIPDLVRLTTCEIEAHVTLTTPFDDGIILSAAPGESGDYANSVVFVINDELGRNDWAAGAFDDALLAPLPGESALLVALNGQLVIVDPRAPRPRHRLNIKRGRAAIRSIGFCKGPRGQGGKHLWVLDDDSKLEVFRFSDGLLARWWQLDSPTSICSHPEGDWLGILSGELGDLRIGLLRLDDAEPSVLDVRVDAAAMAGGPSSALLTDEGVMSPRLRLLVNGNIEEPLELASLAKAPVRESMAQQLVPGVVATVEAEARVAEQGSRAVFVTPSRAGAVLPILNPANESRSRTLRLAPNEELPAHAQEPIEASSQEPLRPAATSHVQLVASREIHRIVNRNIIDDGEASSRTRHLIHRHLERNKAVRAAASEAGLDAIDELPELPLKRHEMVEDFEYPETSPVGALARSLGLDAVEADLLAFLYAAVTDSALKAKLAQISGGRAYLPTVQMAFDLVYRPRTAYKQHAFGLLQRDLPPSGRLAQLGFLLTDGDERVLPDDQLLRLHPRVIRWLGGNTALDPSLRGIATLLTPGDEIVPATASAVASAVAAFRQGGRLLNVSGQLGSGRELLIHCAASRLGRPLLVLRGRLLSVERIRDAFREASLQGALIAVRDADEAFDGEMAITFREALQGWTDTVAILSTSNSPNARLADIRPLTQVTVELPSHTERLAAWRLYLGEGALPEEDLVQVAALYNVGIGAISQASGAALELAASEGLDIARRHVRLAINQLFQSDLAGVAKHVEVKQTWQDIMLPDDLGNAVVNVINSVRNRGIVLDDWGFDQKLSTGRGLLVLLSGPPGTGKSMVAGLIAKDLGLDLYVVDLSRVTSKWLGETEKNLRRAFDAAEAGHVLLLFDEADSVLGRRTSEVKSSNDRYANQETNYLLARLERFGGTAFFTTNAPQSIDPAMLRRMSAHLKFHFPDEQERADIWRRVIPEKTPIGDDVDFERLGRDYRLSGGLIRNIALNAAYLAASDGEPIMMRHLLYCVEQEFRNRGYTGAVSSTDLA